LTWGANELDRASVSGKSKIIKLQSRYNSFNLTSVQLPILNSALSFQDDTFSLIQASGPNTAEFWLPVIGASRIFGF